MLVTLSCNTVHEIAPLALFEALRHTAYMVINDLLSRSEAAGMLGISPRWLTHLLDTTDAPVVRHQGKVKIWLTDASISHLKARIGHRASQKAIVDPNPEASSFTFAEAVEIIGLSRARVSKMIRTLADAELIEAKRTDAPKTRHGFIYALSPADIAELQHWRGRRMTGLMLRMRATAKAKSSNTAS